MDFAQRFSSMVIGPSVAWVKGHLIRILSCFMEVSLSYEHLRLALNVWCSGSFWSVLDMMKAMLISSPFSNSGQIL